MPSNLFKVLFPSELFLPFGIWDESRVTCMLGEHSAEQPFQPQKTSFEKTFGRIVVTIVIFSLLVSTTLTHQYNQNYVGWLGHHALGD